MATKVAPLKLDEELSVAESHEPAPSFTGGRTRPQRDASRREASLSPEKGDRPSQLRSPIGSASTATVRPARLQQRAVSKDLFTELSGSPDASQRAPTPSRSARRSPQRSPLHSPKEGRSGAGTPMDASPSTGCAGSGHVVVGGFRGSGSGGGSKSCGRDGRSTNNGGRGSASTEDSGDSSGGGADKTSKQRKAYALTAYALGQRTLRHFLLLHTTLAACLIGKEAALYQTEREAASLVPVVLHSACMCVAAPLLLLASRKVHLPSSVTAVGAAAILLLQTAAAHAAWHAAEQRVGAHPASSAAVEPLDLHLVSLSVLSAYALLVPAFPLRRVALGTLALYLSQLLTLFASTEGSPSARCVAMLSRELVKGFALQGATRVPCAYCWPTVRVPCARAVCACRVRVPCARAVRGVCTHDTSSAELVPCCARLSSLAVLGAIVAFVGEVHHRFNYDLVSQFGEEHKRLMASRIDLHRLLLNTLPAPVVNEIATSGGIAKCAHRYDEVTVLQVPSVARARRPCASVECGVERAPHAPCSGALMPLWWEIGWMGERSQGSTRVCAAMHSRTCLWRLPLPLPLPCSSPWRTCARGALGPPRRARVGRFGGIDSARGDDGCLAASHVARRAFLRVRRGERNVRRAQAQDHR